MDAGAGAAGCEVAAAGAVVGAVEDEGVACADEE